MNFDKSAIAIGVIVNTFGKKGEVKVLVNDNLMINEDISLKNQYFFYYDENKIKQPLKVASGSQVRENLLHLLFEKIDSMSKAEALKNKTLYVLEQGKLFSKKVNYLEYKVEFESNHEKVSTDVISLMMNGQYNLFKVKWNDKEFWIPGVEEYLVLIDDQNKVIQVKNIERLV